jgi:hypothetical protein
MDGKSKNRRRSAEGFKNFQRFLRLLINIIRMQQCGASEKRDGNAMF